MKTLSLVLIALFLPLIFFAQKSLTGVWSGNLTNDSTTVRSDQTFEIALTQYREKVYGYARSTFIVNDTLFYMVRRVKGKIENGICEVKDDDIISCNFPARIDRGVKRTMTFTMNEADSVWKLDGSWKTNKTKKFYAISGKASLAEEKNPEDTRILAHLQELNIKDAPTVTKVTPIAVPTKPVEVPKEVAKTTVKQTTLPEKDPVVDPPPVIAKTVSPARKDTVLQAETQKQNSIDAVVKNEPRRDEIKTTTPQVTKDSIVTKLPDARIKNTEVAKAPDPIKTEAPKIPEAARFVNERTTAVPQVINFVSDSIQLALYDNGEIDGDTVSVLVNGEIILAKQGLKASAIRKTISIPANASEVTLLLYAENLGKYPPNTGLLVVYDGEERYQVRFTADLNQNAAVVFRRKTK